MTSMDIKGFPTICHLVFIMCVASVMASNAQKACVDGDVGFWHENSNSPLVFYDGSWYPICMYNFGDHGSESANIFCRKLGYESGTSVKAGSAQNYDAMPVGKCSQGQDLTQCGMLLVNRKSGNRYVNRWGQLDYVHRAGSCKAGNNIGLEITCTGKSGPHLVRSCRDENASYGRPETTTRTPNGTPETTAPKETADGFSAWGKFSACRKVGRQNKCMKSRTRNCEYSQEKGHFCDGPTHDDVECSPEECSDGFSAWGKFSACRKIGRQDKCMKSRTRNCEYSQEKGHFCDGPTHDDVECTPEQCSSTMETTAQTEKESTMETTAQTEEDRNASSTETTLLAEDESFGRTETTRRTETSERTETTRRVDMSGAVEFSLTAFALLSMIIL